MTTILSTKTLEANGIRALQDDELDAVTGGVVEGGGVRSPTIRPVEPAKDWVFKDVFAKWTIG